MTSSSASSRPVLNAAATARQFYEPLARDETRRAVERWRSAKERHAQAAAAAREAFEAIGRSSNKPCDRLDAFAAALNREYRAAEAHLIRLLVAWDSAALDNDADNAERQFWPPRGAIVDGVVYLAAPIDPHECEAAGMQPGDDGKDGFWVMALQTFQVASLVNLDAHDIDAPPAVAEVPAAEPSAPAPDPVAAIAREIGNRARLNRTPFPVFQPFMRQVMTFRVPWEPDAPITLEIVVTPDGSGDGPQDDVYDQVISPDEMLKLAEAGWDEHQGAGVTFYTRVIR